MSLLEVIIVYRITQLIQLVFKLYFTAGLAVCITFVDLNEIYIILMCISDRQVVEHMEKVCEILKRVR